MKKIFLSLLSVGFLSLAFIHLNAQVPVKRAFDSLEYTPLPFDSKKTNVYNSVMSVEDPIESSKIYTDFQRVNFIEVNGDPDLMPDLVYKFRWKDWDMGYVSYGGISEYETGYLILVDKSGRVTDKLLVEVGYIWTRAVQFQIYGGYVHVTTIEPVSQEPVLFEDFVSNPASQLEARRVEEIYDTSGGKFIKKQTMCTERPMFFKSQSEFTTDQLDIWNISSSVQSSLTEKQE